MSESDFVFTVNMTMAVAETGSIDDAASIIESAIWDNLPGADYAVESLYVTGRLA